MSDEHIQESLFEDPIGLRFRYARERRHWSQDELSRRIRIPVAIIEAIEREDWDRIGAPVYLRSHLGSYARAVGLPDSVVEEVLAGRRPPPLSPTVDGSNARRMMDRGMLKLAYAVITVALIGTAGMLVNHFQAPARVAQLLPLDVPAAIPGRPAPAPAATNRPATAPAPATAPGSTATGGSEPAAMMASLAPSLGTGLAGNALVLRFNGPSWLEVVDAAGNRIERGLVPAGSERHFDTGQAVNVTFGNAGAVDVSQGGRAVDLAPYRQAEVVRFAVSSQGQILPAGE